MTDRDYNLLKVIISKFIIDIFVNRRLFKAVRLSQGRDEYNGTPPDGRQIHVLLWSLEIWEKLKIVSRRVKATAVRVPRVLIYTPFSVNSPGMVLSRKKPRKPPTNMCVLSNIVTTWSITGTPELQTKDWTKNRSKHWFISITWWYKNIKQWGWMLQQCLRQPSFIGSTCVDRLWIFL